jgi:polar amino acid transport system substrate-binding protein
MRTGHMPRAVVLLAVITLVLAACGTPAASPAPTAAATAAATAAPAVQSAIDRIKAKGGLYVAMYSSPPLSFLDAGAWKGANADFTRECAKDKLGLTPEQIFPIVLPFAAFIPGLQSKRFDVVAGLTINPQRLQAGIATQHIHTWGARPVFRKGDPLVNQVKSWTDMAKAGTELALSSGSNEIAEAHKRNIPIRTYATPDLYVADLKAGRIRMILFGDLGLPALLAANPDLEAVKDPFDYEGIGSGSAFFFNPDDKALRDAFNDCINTMKGSGKVAEVLKTHGIPQIIPPAGPPPN